MNGGVHMHVTFQTCASCGDLHARPGSYKLCQRRRGGVPSHKRGASEREACCFEALDGRRTESLLKITVKSIKECRAIVLQGVMGRKAAFRDFGCTLRAVPDDIVDTLSTIKNAAHHSPNKTRWGAIRTIRRTARRLTAGRVRGAIASTRTRKPRRRRRAPRRARASAEGTRHGCRGQR